MRPTPRTVLSFAGLAVLVLLVAVSSFWAFRRIRETAEARQRTGEAIRRAEALLAAAVDAETGTRGYALTGDESFLEPYFVAEGGLGRQLAELRPLASRSGARARLDAVAPLLEAKAADMARVIALRRGGDLQGAVALVASGRGKRLMDSLRAETGLFVRIEADALAQYEAEYRATLRGLFASLVLASLLALVGALLFAWFLHRHQEDSLSRLVGLETTRLLALQKATNETLRQANARLRLSEDKLAVTLDSIGDAVVATDAAGRVTLLNPRAEQLTGWTQAEAASRPIDEVIHILDPDTRLPFVLPVGEALALGTTQHLAARTLLVARDGRESPIADSCAPIRDDDRRVVGAVLVFRDIAADFAAQQALRDSSAVIQTILNTVADGLMTLRADGGRIETVNPAAERIFGYVAADLVGQPVHLLIPGGDPAHPGGFLASCGSAAATSAPGPGHEVFGRRRDGSPVPLEVAVGEMWLRGERHLTVMLRDITARRDAEERALKAGALQSAIFNSANFSSIATDAKGVIQIFNVGAERMLGYAAADVMDKITPADISDPEELLARAAALSGELGTPILPGFEALVFKASRGIEDIYELTYIRKDGSRFPAVVSVTALRDAQGAIIGYLLIGTDNTARKEVEAEQRRLAQRLRDLQFHTRSLFESNCDALMTTDPAGIVTDVNKEMETLTGCTRDELIGAPFKDHFTDPERAEASVALVLSQKKLTDYELTVRAMDGRETAVSYNATPLYDRERRLQGMFAAARDVTERKRLDQVLREKHDELEKARARADKANLAKSEFLSGMSHELRSPLNAILGFAQLMESDSRAPTPPQQESIAQILQAGWHLLKLIDEILDLSKVESGKVRLSREPVSLAEVLLECEGMVEGQAQLHGISVTYPRFDGPCFVLADRTRVAQVLLNLLSNAIKYNAKGGAVEVTYAERATGRVRVTIRDEGAGLRPDQQAQLFQAFNRLGQEAGSVEGTGIGLVVAKRLVELMGGSIGVESAAGRGSSFWFELLSSTAPRLVTGEYDPTTGDLPSAARTGRFRTLLYVEDNKANLKLVEQIVARHADLRLLTATTGRAGVATAQASLPDVVLMDINLPDIDGFEALRLLRRDPVTANIPVLALSANAMPQDIEKGRQAGFLRYLTKPIRVNRFMEALNLALSVADRQAPEAVEEVEEEACP